MGVLLGGVLLAGAGSPADTPADTPADIHAEIHGVITIERKLTRRNVTASGGMYQRGVAVELGADADSDPLAFERSHVAVYLEGGPNSTTPGAAKVSIEQRDRRFVPDIAVIPAGSSISFPNFDPIFHNVFSLSKPKSFDLGNYPKGQSRVVAFDKPGVVAVYCHLHSNMAATIVVTPNRWATRADGNGAFSLKDVAPGTYTVIAWHKTAGTFRKTVTIKERGDAEVNFTLPYVGPGDGKPTDAKATDVKPAGQR
jgi:plastocyanin